MSGILDSLGKSCCHILCYNKIKLKGRRVSNKIIQNLMKFMANLSFIYSTRFIKIVLIGVIEGLLAVNVIEADTSVALVRILEAILGASVVVRTIDRFSEKIGA